MMHSVMSKFLKNMRSINKIMKVLTGGEKI